MSFTSQLVNEFIALIESLGYLGVFFSVGIEYACFPLPSEVILPFVGYIASRGAYSLVGAIFISVLAGLIGSTVCYFIGYYGGSAIISKITTKFPSSRKSFEYIEKFMSKYDKFTVFITRLLPLTRTYVSLLVGSVRMPFIPFILYSLGGITIWNTMLISLGYYFGENTDMIASILSKYSFVVFGIIALGGIFYIYRKFINKKNKC